MLYMKAASGELSLTVITIIAIGAVIGFFWLLWPTIKSGITDQWDNIAGSSDPTISYIIPYTQVK